MRHDTGNTWQHPEDEVRYSIAFQRTPHNGPEGVPLEEAERNALARLRQGWTLDALNELLAVYRQAGREEKVRNCLIALAETTPDLELRALFYVYLGQSFERTHEYEGAIDAYREAMALEPCGGFAAYFLHNNLAYCLNLFGCHVEAERLALIAVQVDPGRPYAYKNLGVSLEGQGDFQGAFAAWVYATRVNAADDRSLALMQMMLEVHPELLAVPGVRESLEECRRAVAFARQLMHSARN